MKLTTKQRQDHASLTREELVHYVTQLKQMIHSLQCQLREQPEPPKP